MLFMSQQGELEYLAPYAWGIVLGGILTVIVRVIYKEIAFRHDWVHFRKPLWYRSLSRKRKQILTSQFDFFHQLGKSDQKLLEHRTQQFILQKNYVPRQLEKVTDEQKVLIAATACMLTLGRRNYNYGQVDHILVYPQPFVSVANEALHKGEFNPMQKAIVFSWPDFKEGYQVTNDNLNLGIHEFMHALHIEALNSTDVDSMRFEKYMKLIFVLLKSSKEMRERLLESKYFRDYAFSNGFEFMSVLAEYYYESPEEFKERFPRIYFLMAKLFNFSLI